MELNTFERLTLLNILPPEGDLITIRVLHGLKERLGFTEEELQALELRTEGQRVFWKPEADKEVDVEIGSKAESIIRETLEKLNKDKKIKEEHLSLCDKFKVE